jgi:hypothetical protein
VASAGAPPPAARVPPPAPATVGQPLGEPAPTALPVAERTAPATSAPPPAAGTRPSEPSAAASTAEIAAALDGFALALESRRLDRLQAAYPGMTPAEQSTWKGFFDGVRDLRVQVAGVQTPQLSGSRAQVSFTMTLAFTDRRGLQQTVQTYRATLARAESGWRLDAVRPEQSR